MELSNATLDVNDWLADLSRSTDQQLTIKPMFKELQFLRLLLPLSPNSNTMKLLPTWLTSKLMPMSSKPQKECRTSMVPRTARASPSPTHQTQFHSELSTLKLKVWGGSKLAPSVWERAAKVLLAKRRVLCLAFLGYIPKSGIESSSPTHFPFRKYENAKGLRATAFCVKLFTDWWKSN